MKYSDSTISVQASAGDYGYLKVRGKIKYKEVLEEALNVLEGGVSQFIKKIESYEELTNMVLPWSSLRMRTIEKLKDYLVQIQSTPLTTLNALSHEINNGRFDVHNLIDSIDSLEHGESKPTPTNIELFSFLDGIRIPYSEQRQVITLDSKLSNVFAYVDRSHLKFIFVNLIENSFRATSAKIAELFANDPDLPECDLISKIDINLERVSDHSIDLIFWDNGCGIKPDIRKKLYKEKCTDQGHSESNGLGGILIKEWLERNGGNIEVIDSSKECGTKQRITLLSHHS
jgi:signal transduction histidine kinase